MALEELIVAWSKERLPWQREIMRRVATGDILGNEEYDKLVERILADKRFQDVHFGLEHLPEVKPEDLSVRLDSVADLEHVNALQSKDPLTFESEGLTIVYGDNGSGKSGYARLLKGIARTRHQEEVLTDVFRDSSIAKPTATLGVLIGEAKEFIAWPKESRPELQRMLFYDVACGSAYIASESDFPYRPSALFVMDGLIKACVAIRERIDIRLGENEAMANELPIIPEQARNTDIGRFLASLSGGSSVKMLDAFIAKFDESKETIEQLKDQEAFLRSADTTNARQQLNRQSEKLEAVRAHIGDLESVLGGIALSELQQRRNGVNTLRIAVDLLASSFESEPLQGVGSSPWKALWEAARRYSMEHAYPSQDFPFLGGECRCVLCQQPLDTQGQERLIRFEEFVRNDAQVQLQEARRVYEGQVKTIKDLAVAPEVITNHLKDLEGTHREIVDVIRELLGKQDTLREQALDAISNGKPIPKLDIDQGPIISSLTEASTAAKGAAQELANPEGIQTQLAALAVTRARLELLKQVKTARLAIASEIARLKERAQLEAVKSAATTTGITKKILEFSEEGITEVVHDAFTEETKTLRLERVAIERTRADKGTLLHQPKLVGARPKTTLPRVFSEGEKTALGLAAFFTEARIDTSNSALILDDPVTSLDHTRRGLVASRLAAFAETRQVIVFTHDVAFVADLKLEAKGKGVPVCERSVTKSRADGQKPGKCIPTHPWKAKDVSARLNELRNEVARIKRDSANWEPKEYEDAVANCAGNLSETWERIFSQEIVGPILCEGGLEVRPKMVKMLVHFSLEDQTQFDASYSRISRWAKRHDKSVLVNYVAPEVVELEAELGRVDTWFKRIRGYKT